MSKCLPGVFIRAHFFQITRYMNRLLNYCSIITILRLRFCVVRQPRLISSICQTRAFLPLTGVYACLCVRMRVCACVCLFDVNTPKRAICYFAEAHISAARRVLDVGRNCIVRNCSLAKDLVLASLLWGRLLAIVQTCIREATDSHFWSENVSKHRFRFIIFRHC